MSIRATGVYKNQGKMIQIHLSLSTSFGLRPILQGFVRGRFQGSYYFSNLKFYMRIYI